MHVVRRGQQGHGLMTDWTANGYEHGYEALLDFVN